MKIQKVSHNNYKEAFEISTMGKQYIFPYKLTLTVQERVKNSSGSLIIAGSR